MFSKFNVQNSNWFTTEFFRTIPLIILAILMFAPDWSTLLVVKYVFGFLFAIALITHTIRKVLFPYISLRDYAAKALETSQGAAVVFFGFCIIICTVIFAAVEFFQ